MAGTKLSIQSKIKASTILEVLIAMVIIMVVFGIAMMIYANVMRSSLSIKKVRAQQVLNEVIMNAEKSNDNITQSITLGDIRVEQTVNHYGDNKNLMQIDLVAYDGNQQKITELHIVIPNRNEQPTN